MATVRTTAKSFAGGEITPELYGRFDLTKFQTGLAGCRNLVVLPHGPVRKRPGLEYVIQAKSTTVRLIPFSFNTEQTYIIEMGPSYLRFHYDGQTLLTAAQNVTSITAASPGVLTYAGADPANGDWAYVTGTDDSTLDNRYFVVTNVDTGANTFELYDLRGNPVTVSAAIAAGSVQFVFEVASPWTASEIFDVNFTQSADVMTLVHPNRVPRTLTRDTATTFALATESYVPGIGAPTGVSLTSWITTTTHDYSWKVTAVNEGGIEESVPSSSATLQANFQGAFQQVLVEWTAPTTGTPVRYHIYRQNYNRGLFGYVGSADGLQFLDTITEPDFSATPPSTVNPFNSTDNYPRAVSYFEQRKVLGGTNNSPQGYWFTVPGTETSMVRAIPTVDTDAIMGRIVAQEINEIRHFVPLSELLVLTAGAVWRMDSTGNGLSASTLRSRRQASVGSSQVVPQVTTDSILFVDASGNRIHSLRYSWERDAYTPVDTSIMAPHMFENTEITQLAYSGGTNRILWVTTASGELLGLTFIPEHEVAAWHRHTTTGSFQSVAVVQEGSEYRPYVAVNRVVEGATRTYIERMHTEEYTTLEDYFGVDSGATYSGTATNSVIGLWHLEGKTVKVLADGSVFPDQVVTNGTITLPNAQKASKIHVGLGFSPRMELLPLALQAGAGSQGLMLNVTRAYIRMYRASGVQIGMSDSDLVTYPQRTTEPYGSPPNPIEEEIEIMVPALWNREGRLIITQDDPLPFTAVSLSLEVEVGG